MSVRSFGHAPAIGHAVMLRTVLPHASRVVRPARARSRIASGVSLERDRVDLDRFARRDVRVRRLECALAIDVGRRRRAAIASSLSGVEPPARRLDAQHVDARLPLAVAALLQAHRREAVLGDLAGAERGDGVGVAVDLGEVGQVARRAGRQRLDVEMFGGAHRGSALSRSVRDGAGRLAAPEGTIRASVYALTRLGRTATCWTGRECVGRASPATLLGSAWPRERSGSPTCRSVHA